MGVSLASRWPHARWFLVRVSSGGTHGGACPRPGISEEKNSAVKAALLAAIMKRLAKANQLSCSLAMVHALLAAVMIQEGH